MPWQIEVTSPAASRLSTPGHLVHTRAHLRSLRRPRLAGGSLGGRWERAVGALDAATPGDSQQLPAAREGDTLRAPNPLPGSGAPSPHNGYDMPLAPAACPIRSRPERLRPSAGSSGPRHMADQTFRIHTRAPDLARRRRSTVPRLMTGRLVAITGGGSMGQSDHEYPADQAAGHGERLMLLDAASLYFRAFYGVPDRRPRPDAAPTNALRGFLDMVATLVSAHRPDRLVACWDDDWRPAFRVAAVPTYKTHRLESGSTTQESVPDQLTPQVPLIAAALAAVGLARVGCPGYEADDVIGTLTARAGGPVDIVTGDRDLFQLVDDASSVRVLYTAKGGVRSPTIVSQSYLRTTYGVPDGPAYADVATLRGDPSDGLPGVPGVGEKTATSLIATFGDLEALRAAADSNDHRLSPTQRRRLLEARNYLDVAPGVVRVARDCPLPQVDARLPTVVADPSALASLITEFGVGGPVGRLLTALRIDPSAS